MIIKHILPVILICLLSSCKSLKSEQDIYGDFYKKGQDYEYSLTLNKDRTFVLTIKYQDANPSCIGKWEKSNGSEIHLKCDDVENPTETISSSYMNEREHKIEIISSNKLRFKNTVLNRK